MATKTKYDPLEASKLGTDAQPAPSPEAFSTPKAAAAPAPTPPAADQPRRRPRFTVVKDKQVSIRGMLCSFKAGRVIDSAGYDVDQLRAQGLELEPLKED